MRTVQRWRNLAAMNKTPRQAMPTASALGALLDVLGWPLLLLRQDQTLLLPNRAAQTVLKRGQPLMLSAQRRVMASDGRRQRSFEAACRAVIEDAEAVLLRWRTRGAASGLWASLTLLPGADDGEPALLLALSPETGDGSDLAAFAALHGLSHTQTRVLQRLALGESSARAAAVLGLSASTVRSHALSLRRKTGHATLGELVHALATLPPMAPMAAIAAVAPPRSLVGD